MLCQKLLLFIPIVLCILPQIVSCDSCETYSLFDGIVIACNSLKALNNYPNPDKQVNVEVNGESLNNEDWFICDKPYFENFTSLKGIRLRHIKLLHVSADCFSGMENLTSIDLSNNFLTTINVKSFKTSDAIKLEGIRVDSNHIVDMDFTEYELPDLLRLDVSRNRLKYIEVTSEKMPKINYIDLSSNEISSFQIESKTLTTLNLARNRIKAFSGANLVLPNLKEINLEGNFLARITPDLMANMPNLVKIYLSHNLLEIVSFPTLKELIHLELTYNSIKNLNDLNISADNVQRFHLRSNNIFKLDGDKLKLENVEIFSCQSCSIHYIDQFFLANTFGKLKYLYLQSNSLTSTNIFQAKDGNFTLKYIDMSSNVIRRIGGKDFECLTKVEVLNLYSNEIATIEVGAFDAMIELRDLNLSNNLLFNLPVNLFERTASLIELWLNGNNLVYFPIPGWQEATGVLENSSAFRKLRDLRIQRNPLQCKCVELLRSWAKMKRITLLIDDQNVRSGTRPACIANNQGCKADVGKDFIRDYWHLFNYITLRNIFDNGQN